MWPKLKALCLHSLTIAWSYVVAGVGAALNVVDNIADALGDPALKDSINSALGGNPKVLGSVLVGISVVTIIARLRTLRKAS
jgi:hypothetical protein